MRWILLVALLCGCSNTFIDLSPDVAEEDTAPDADGVADTEEIDGAEEDADLPEIDATAPDEAGQEDTPAPDEVEAEIVEEAEYLPDVIEDTLPEDTVPDVAMEDIPGEEAVDEATSEDATVPDEAEEEAEAVVDVVEDEATAEDSGVFTLCEDYSVWSTVDDIAPFVPTDYLWTGTRNPTRGVGVIGITDRSALFTIAGAFSRTLTSYDLTLPGFTPLAGVCQRYVFHAGLGNFFVETSPVLLYFVADDRTHTWSPGVTMRVEEEWQCDTATSEGWIEYRVDGDPVIQQTWTPCSTIGISSMVVSPPYLARCTGIDPIPPARPVTTYSPVTIGAFCFAGEP